jgi:hypothetical protein
MNNKTPETSKAGSWTVYILECSNQSLYTGIATHLGKRIARHENGNGARYTRGRGPFESSLIDFSCLAWYHFQAGGHGKTNLH